MACNFCGLERATTSTIIENTAFDVCNECKKAIERAIINIPKGQQDLILIQQSKLIMARMNQLSDRLEAIITHLGII